MKQTVSRWVTTARPAASSDATVNGRCRSGVRVSGRRSHAQISRPDAASAGTQKTIRHGATAFSPAPRVGATIGTSRNTAMIIDICRAIADPSYRSRIRAMLSERGAAAPRPHTNRAATTNPNDGATAAAAALTMYSAKPANSGLRRP